MKIKKLNESIESKESELITQYINNGEFDKLEKVHNGTNVVWKLKDTNLKESIEVETIGDYITDHYDFDDIDDKYSCINSIRDSFKDEKTISKEELEQFIGSHNGRDKVNESKSINEGNYDDYQAQYNDLYHDAVAEDESNRELFNQVKSELITNYSEFVNKYKKYGVWDFENRYPNSLNDENFGGDRFLSDATQYTPHDYIDMVTKFEYDGSNYPFDIFNVSSNATCFYGCYHPTSDEPEKHFHRTVKDVYNLVSNWDEYRADALKIKKLEKELQYISGHGPASVNTHLRNADERGPSKDKYNAIYDVFGKYLQKAYQDTFKILKSNGYNANKVRTNSSARVKGTPSFGFTVKDIDDEQIQSIKDILASEGIEVYDTTIYKDNKGPKMSTNDPSKYREVLFGVWMPDLANKDKRPFKNESKSIKESSATHCVYFTQDGIDQVEFEGTEDECYDYIASIESEQDDEFGDEYPERFIKRLTEASEGFQKEFYCDYVILRSRVGDGWDIYSYDGTPEKVTKAYLEDEGFATLQAAKDEIDKWNDEAKLDESTQPLYIIKDKNGNQLSAPNPDDGELWDRVASMEARGRTGLSVVAYVDKTNASKGPYIKLYDAADYIDELDFAGAVEIKGDKVYGDETTLKQLANALYAEFGFNFKIEEKLTEASYGGAFDIRDDQFFTREDIENAAEEVMNHIAETFTEPYHLGGTWFENNQWIVNVQGEQFDEYEVSLPVDMRKIKEPWHLKRAYANEMAAKLIGQIKEYNGMNEAVTSSSFEFDDDIDDLSYYYDDEQLKSGYMYIKSKSVPDSDGFMTDYTMYQDIESGEYVFIFGDNEVYTPDNSEFDHECETAEEADEWFNSYNGFEDMDEGYPKHKTLEEAYDPYDPANGWTEEDIAFHKSIDWKARNYEPYVDENDTFEGEVVTYGLPGGPRKANVTFAKNFSANPIFSPSYKPTSNPFEHTVGFMYDGHKHNGYLVMDRTETQDVYDMLSH